MLANWIHIVIVHVSVIATPWLLYLVFKHRQTALDVKSWKIIFSGLIILSALTGIAYFSGPETADYVKEIITSFPQDQVEDHALWGRIAFVIQVFVGLIAIMAWASILQQEKPARYIPNILIVLLLINTFVILYTAHLGGLIRRIDLL